MARSFHDWLREDWRLAMLQILAESMGYSANLSVLCTLLERMAHHLSRDQVRAELAWLADQGLVTLQDLGATLVARLTERGADVAAGRALVPGVKRPSP